MGDKTGIEWTDATWNPVTGCTKVSPGCDHCYAETIAHRFAGTKSYPNGFDVTLRPERLDQPLRWTKPRKVFVNSMSDLFHDAVPTEVIADVFATMALAQRHTFQILTKRPARMHHLLTAAHVKNDRYPCITTTFYDLVLDSMGRRFDPEWAEEAASDIWPLPNVWLGVSTEDQKWADIRIPQLLATPAAARFISAEPLLAGIDLSGYVGHLPEDEDGAPYPRELDWVIVGGESGPGARPMHPQWARDLRDQCVQAKVPFHFKQWGEWAPIGPDNVATRDEVYLDAETGKGTYYAHRYRQGVAHLARVGKKAAGRDLDGRTWDEVPECG